MKTLLVVDDEVIIGMIFSFALEPLGYKVVTLTDPHMALEAARLHKPDVVVLDYHMPEINGVELHAMLKADGCKDKVLFVTADEAITEQLRADGDFGVAKKPLILDDLVSLVNVIMPIARMSRLLEKGNAVD